MLAFIRCVGSSAFASVRRGSRQIVEDRRSLWPTVLVMGLLLLAFARLFLSATPILPLLFNWTPSLPYHVAWLERGATIKHGDFVLYSYGGPLASKYPGLRGQPFFKVVAGEPGDPIRVDGRNVYVRERFVGFAKLRTMDGRPLNPVAATKVPESHIYVRGSGADSLDSRYVEGGFVPQSAIIGRVHPWF
ncbi:MAG: conjugative transfer signal peptidase TraF [Thermomicrobiales bacterium]|nr:MAG: conjugative transfer signal peptidase TraF [Thermomicrobiales bacterium]